MTQRSLAEWLVYLEQLHPTAIDLGLDRVRDVARHLDLRKPAPRVVTVTGTNGKGSTCAFLAQLLRAQGLRVGVYSSPHLLHYNERVRIDDGEASDAELCEAFAVVEHARGEISLTYFEMGTLAAFWLFQQANLDAVVLEVGLGGRLDAVNLFDADVAVVTSIGLDHAEWLGDTRDSVAFEKSGIFRQGSPVVCGDTNPPAVLRIRAAELDAPFFLRGKDFDFTPGEHSWDWQGVDLGGCELRLEKLPLLDLPVENAAVALQAYCLLGLDWRPERLSAALMRTSLRGRLDRWQLEYQGKCLALLLDVGHNPHAAGFLAERFSSGLPVNRRLAVFGLLGDKDLQGVLDAVHPFISHWAVASLPSARSRSAQELQQALSRLGAVVTEHDSVADALSAQCDQAESGDEVLVFGSFYCVAEALTWLIERGAVNGRFG